jgi:hypothetical protein
MRKMGLSNLQKANARIINQTQTCDYGENIDEWHRKHRPPQQWEARQASPTTRAKSNPNFPALEHQMADHGDAYQEAVKFSVHNKTSKNPFGKSLLMASNKQAIEIDKKSVMSKADRSDALRSFYD